MPKISIVTVARNAASTIGQTVRSVVAQTVFRDTEMLLVDGGSSDRTVDIAVEAANGQVRVVHQKDRGIYEAMNLGIEAARGEYVGFLNADDFYCRPDALALVLTAARDKPDCIYGDIDMVDYQNPDLVLRRWRTKSFSLARARVGWHPPHPAFFARRARFIDWGTFNTRYRISADYDLMMRFLVKHQASSLYLPEVLVRMRVGGASNRSAFAIAKGNIEVAQSCFYNGLGYWFVVPILKPLRKLLQ